MTMDDKISDLFDVFPILVKPFWTKIKSIDEKPFDTEKNLFNISYLKKEDTIVANCVRESTLHIMNLNTNSISDYKYSKISNAGMMCVGKNDDLFVSESYPHKKIYVFNSKMRLKEQIYVDSKLTIGKMKVDFTDSEYPLYMSHTEENKISVWNTESSKLLRTIDIDEPLFVEFTKDYIYVTSMTNYDYGKSKELTRIKSGTNGICILNKLSAEFIKTISFDNWLQPFGLYIDANCNLITVAKEIDEKKRILENRFVYILSETGLLSHKIEIKMGPTNDIKFFDNKMLRTNGSSVEIIEFE